MKEAEELLSTLAENIDELLLEFRQVVSGLRVWDYYMIEKL